MEAGGHSNVIKYNDLVGLGRRRVLRDRHRLGVDQGRLDRVRQRLPLGQHRRHAGRREGRPQRTAPDERPDPGCPGVIDFDGHCDPDHAITFVRDNGDGTCETLRVQHDRPERHGGRLAQGPPAPPVLVVRGRALMAGDYFTARGAARRSTRTSPTRPSTRTRSSRPRAPSPSSGSRPRRTSPTCRARPPRRWSAPAARGCSSRAGPRSARSRPRRSTASRSPPTSSPRSRRAATASSSAPLAGRTAPPSRSRTRTATTEPVELATQAVMMLAAEHAKPSTIPARATSLNTDVGSLPHQPGRQDRQDRHPRRRRHHRPARRRQAGDGMIDELRLWAAPGRAAGGARRAGGAGRRRRRRGGARPRLPGRRSRPSTCGSRAAPRASSTFELTGDDAERRDLPHDGLRLRAARPATYVDVRDPPQDAGRGRGRGARRRTASAAVAPSWSVPELPGSTPARTARNRQLCLELAVECRCW